MIQLLTSTPNPAKAQRSRSKGMYYFTASLFPICNLVLNKLLLRILLRPNALAPKVEAREQQ